MNPAHLVWFHKARRSERRGHLKDHHGRILSAPNLCYTLDCFHGELHWFIDLMERTTEVTLR